MKADFLVVDLDGTLIDVSMRHYCAYIKSHANYGVPTLPFEEYWFLKRSGVSWDQIFEKVKADDRNKKLVLNDFKKYIESSDLLSHDRLFEGVNGILKTLSIHMPIYLVTLRRSRVELEKQLLDLKIKDIFCKIISPNADCFDKRVLVDSTLFPGLGGVWIGDTEVDIIAAKHFKLKSIAVESGLRSKEYLSKFSPDNILATFSDYDLSWLA